MNAKKSPKLYDEKPVAWAKVNPETLRLESELQYIKKGDPGPQGWYQLDNSVALMIINETKPAEAFALIKDKIVEVPLDVDLRFLSHVSPDEWPEITLIDHKWTKVPWIPLDYPRIEPDNWDLFWELWNSKNAEVGRPGTTGQNYWTGLCIWLHPRIKPEQFNYSNTVVDDWSAHFPKMFDDIRNCVPWIEIEKIVLWSNVNQVFPHFDPDRLIYPFPDSLRVMLWDTNETPTFYMTKWPERSEFNHPMATERTGGRGYGIRPHLRSMDKRMYVNLPPDTNTFLVNNGAFIHGADLAKPKIIMAIKGDINIVKLLKHLEASYNKYKEYIPDASKF